MARATRNNASTVVAEGTNETAPAAPEAPVVKTTYAQNAYGPDGQVIAQSYDSGKTWKKTEAGLALDEKRPTPQVFNRRVVALSDTYTPAFARRIEAPFLRLSEVGVMAGQMPVAEAFKLEERQMDGIVLPGLVVPEILAQIKARTKSIILDLNAPLVWSQEERDLFYEIAREFDAITVPTNLLASRIRPYHDRVFVIPHLLREDIWLKVEPRQPQKTVVIGHPAELDATMHVVFGHLQEIYGDKVEFQAYDWARQFPGDEALLYPDFDVIVLPPPHDRYQGSMAPILPAMAAQCTVVAERSWPGIKHAQDGLLVGRHTAQAWLNELRRAVSDSRLRQRIGKAARTQAWRYTTQKQKAAIYLPYRLVVPEGEPQVFSR